MTNIHADAGSDATTQGRIMRVAKSGGAPSVVASGQIRPTQIAADGVSVYWSTFDDKILRLARCW